MRGNFCVSMGKNNLSEMAQLVPTAPFFFVLGRGVEIAKLFKFTLNMTHNLIIWI